MLAVLIGRFVRAVARMRKRDGGTALPGAVMNALAPRFLVRTLNSFPNGLVIVSGSSGKSTTTKMLVAILRAQGLNVFTNPSTANISQGLTSALLSQADVRGRVRGDIAVLEMDEAHGALIAPQLQPRIVVLTNVMTDQIDRFDDPQKVALMLNTIAQRASESVVVNGDDAFVNAVARRLDPHIRILRYGVSQRVFDEAHTGLGFARSENTRLTPGEVTIVESVEDRTARINSHAQIVDISLPARGVHFALDAVAALDGARAVQAERFELDSAIAALAKVPPVFGRGEIVEIRGQQVEFVLVQNPASFQLNVDTLPGELDSILVALGSDVRDPSYLWSVDLTRLRRVRVATGSHAYEIALQLEYQGVAIDRIEPNLPVALESFLAAPPPQKGMKTIIFSAESMRRTRTHLGLVEREEGSS